MFRKFALAGSLAVLCAGVAVGAQQDQQQPATGQQTEQQQPATQEPATGQQRASAGQQATLEGCVYREQDVPGRTPNVAERAGVLEDYILVVSGASAGTAGATGTSGTAGAETTAGAREPSGAATGTTAERTGEAAGATAGTATGTSGVTGGTMSSQARMYKLEHVSDEQLRSMVGKRVQVTGRIDAEAGDTVGTTGQQPGADQSIGPDQIDLAELEVATIREAQGECPSTPQVNR